MMSEIQRGYYYSYTCENAATKMHFYRAGARFRRAPNQNDNEPSQPAFAEKPLSNNMQAKRLPCNSVNHNVGIK